MKNETQRNGNGSSNLIWLLRSVIAQSVWSEGVSTLHLDTRVVLVFMRIAVLGVLFSLRGTLAITSLSSLPVFILAHFVSSVPLDAWLGIYVGFALCSHFLWHSVSSLVYAIPS